MIFSAQRERELSKTLIEGHFFLSVSHKSVESLNLYAGVGAARLFVRSSLLGNKRTHDTSHAMLSL